MNTTKRIGWLDSCKGFAILSVVLGHVCDGYLNAGLYPAQQGTLSVLLTLVSSFHMPLFFLLSGYVFYLAYCAQRAQRRLQYHTQLCNMAWIYFLFSTVQWAFKVFFSSSVNNPLTIRDLLMMPIKPMNPYWYLYVLFFFYLIFDLLHWRKLPDVPVLVGSLLISWVSAVRPLPDFSFPLQEILFYLAAFSIGVYLAKRPDSFLLSRPFTAACGVLSALFFGCVLFSKPFPFVIPGQSFFLALVIPLFFVGLFYRLKFLGRCLPLTFLGAYCLEIYVTHCFITAGNRVFLPKIGLTAFLPNVIVNFLMAALLPVVCAILLKKLHLHTPIFHPASLLQKKKYNS